MSTDETPLALKVSAASKKYGITSAKLRALRAAGAFPGAYRSGSSQSCHWYIPVAEIEAWIAERQRAERVVPRPTRTRGQG